MGKIVQLKNKATGEYEYPRTSTKAVIDENGNTIDNFILEHLENHDTEIDSKISDTIYATNEIFDIENADETLVTEALRKTPQTLSEAEKLQVRDNLGVVSINNLKDHNNSIDSHKDLRNKVTSIDKNKLDQIIYNKFKSKVDIKLAELDRKNREQDIRITSLSDMISRSKIEDIDCYNGDTDYCNQYVNSTISRKVITEKDNNQNQLNYYLKGASIKKENLDPCILVAGQYNPELTTSMLPLDILNNLPLDCQVYNNITYNFDDFDVSEKDLWDADLIAMYNLTLRTRQENVYVIKQTSLESSIDENGLGLGHWTADYENIYGDHYSELRGFEDTINECLYKYPDKFNIKAIIWLQNFGDEFPATVENYYDNFKNMIAYIRGIVGNTKLPFIFSTQSRNSSRYNATIESAQIMVGQTDPFCFCIDMSGATMFNKTGNTFSAESTIYLGEMIYDKLVDAGVVNTLKINPSKIW